MGEEAGVFIHQLLIRYWLWAASGGIHSGTSSLHCVQQNTPHDRGLQMLADFLFLDIHVPSVTHYPDPIHFPLSK